MTEAGGKQGPHVQQGQRPALVLTHADAADRRTRGRRGLGLEALGVQGLHRLYRVDRQPGAATAPIADHQGPIGRSQPIAGTDPEQGAGIEQGQQFTTDIGQSKHQGADVRQRDPGGDLQFNA